MRLRLVVPTSGRDVRTLAQAQSAVWAPDRRHAATLRDGRVMVASLEEVTPLGAGAPLGKIVVTNGAPFRRHANSGPSTHAPRVPTACRPISARSTSGLEACRGPVHASCSPTP
jgi:hypothetical protein